jgi:hypothetical protein
MRTLAAEESRCKSSKYSANRLCVVELQHDEQSGQMLPLPVLQDGGVLEMRTFVYCMPSRQSAPWFELSSWYTVDTE